jgi:hypothetical protein
MFDRLKSISKNLKTEIKVYQLVLKDPRTPWAARIVLGLAVVVAAVRSDPRLYPHYRPYRRRADRSRAGSVGPQAGAP